MVKVRIGTTISFLVNLFLTFWLVNQYLNDVYFQNYVNTSIGPYSPFIVLTIGLGGGSGFGYVLLKRRHGDQGLVGNIPKSKYFKPGSLLSTRALAGVRPGQRWTRRDQIQVHSIRTRASTLQLDKGHRSQVPRFHLRVHSPLQFHQNGLPP